MVKNNQCQCSSVVTVFIFEPEKSISLCPNFNLPLVKQKCMLVWIFNMVFNISNGCFDAYEVKVNKDIFKYQEKVKLISQFQRFFFIF